MMPDLNTLYIRETAHIQSNLQAIPSPSLRASKRFLNTFQIKYHQINHLKVNSHQRQPLDIESALRVGVTIGQLLNKYSEDELLLKRSSDLKNPSPSSIDTSYSPSNVSIGLNKTLPAVFKTFNVTRSSHILFLNNLDRLLKMMDVSPGSDRSLYVFRGRSDVYGKSNRDSTVSAISNYQHQGPKYIQVQTAVIEKLESNMDLDIAFVHRILFRVIIKVYDTLTEIHDQNVEPLQQNDLQDSVPEVDDSESIFSTCLSQQEPLSYEEYVALCQGISTRIMEQLVEPFMRYILLHVVEPHLQSDFNRLVDAL